VARLAVRARVVGAESVQTFASNPRGWAVPREDKALLTRVRKELELIGPLFVHAPYLVNLVSPSEGFRRRSKANLVWQMRRAAALGAAGVVVHAGAAGATRRSLALQRFRRAAIEALQAASAPLLIVELTAGGSGSLAGTWEQAAEILAIVEAHPRVRFCFDTCHAFAAGYDLSSAGGVRSFLNDMRSIVGAERLAVVHANDSRDPLGSRRDRHWHIGEGSIGAAGFRALLADPAVSGVPILIETPGSPDDDRRNMARLRRFARPARAPRA
jgi:deoxyribonuclease-4